MREESKGAFLHQRRTLCVVGRADALQARSYVPYMIYCSASAGTKVVHLFKFKFRCGETLPDLAITDILLTVSIPAMPGPSETLGGGAQLHRIPESRQLIHSWSLLYL